MFWDRFLGVLVGVHVRQGGIEAMTETSQVLKTAQVC